MADIDDVEYCLQMEIIIELQSNKNFKTTFKDTHTLCSFIPVSVEQNLAKSNMLLKKY